MKKKIPRLLSSLAVMLVIFSSCQKELDVAKSDEVMGTPLPGQPTYCRIESLWERPGASDQRFILFLYDEFENPTAITTPVPSTGHPYRTFKYDTWHRLREYRGEYSNGNYEFWHFYGFDLNGRIGLDTNYTLGAMGPTGPLTYFERSISQITYDSQGRIIKVVTDTQISPSHTETTYSYDGAGNLIYPPAWGVVYDNKMSLNRTNDIWQFLNRDYSMNNPFIADAYNSTGFPTVINASGIVPQWLGEYEISFSQLSYNCRTAFW